MQCLNIGAKTTSGMVEDGKREKHESVRMPDSVCHVVGSGSRYWQWGVNTRGWLQ